MRIELNAGGLGGVAYITTMQSNIMSLIGKSDTLLSALRGIKNYTYNMNGGVGNLQGALSNVETHIQTAENQKSNLSAACEKIDSFIGLTKAVDLNVSKIVNRNKNEFYSMNPWSHPPKQEMEKKWYEQLYDWACGVGNAIKDTVKKAWEGIKSFCKEIKTKWIEWKKENFYNKLSLEHKENIETYVDQMDEPYKSIYLQNYYKYKMGHISGEDTGYYTTSNNSINVDMSEEPTNPRGPYVTFFHESAHAIDYNYNKDGTYYSMSYRNAEGKSLQDVIYEDVRDDIQNTVSNYVADESTSNRIVNYFMGARSVSENSLSDTEKAIVSQIQHDYYVKFNGAVNEAPSDVYGGVTDNLIIGSYGHRPDSSKGQTYYDYYYWYNKSGNATYAQSRELWAEYYSYCATGDTDNLEALSEHFPKSKAFLDEMATSMQK